MTFTHSLISELSSLPDVATEAVILAPSVTLRDQDGSHVDDLVEFSISKEINRQFPGTLWAARLGGHSGVASYVCQPSLQSSWTDCSGFDIS